MSKWNEDLIEPLKHSTREVFISVLLGAVVYLVLWVRQNDSDYKNLDGKYENVLIEDAKYYKQSDERDQRENILLQKVPIVVYDTIYVPFSNRK